MTTQQLPGVTSTLRAQGWAHPRPGLSLDDLIVSVSAQGMTILEIHRDCDCVGSGRVMEDDKGKAIRDEDGRAVCSTGPDDHLLVLDKEVVR